METLTPRQFVRLREQKAFCESIGEDFQVVVVEKDAPPRVLGWGKNRPDCLVSRRSPDCGSERQVAGVNRQSVPLPSHFVPLSNSMGQPYKSTVRPIVPLLTGFFSRARTRAHVNPLFSMGQIGHMGQT